MASGDATPLPIKNQAFRVTFPILDADGDLVTGATALDSEVSKDAGTFADCTNEATEVATSSGVYYLDLTATEMNADTVVVIVKTSSTGAKTTTLVLYPVTNGLDIPVDTRYVGGTAQTARDIGASVLLSPGTGTGQLDITSGVVKANATQFAGQTITCAAGVTVLASVGTAATSTAQTGDSYALANGANGFVAIKGDTAAILDDTGTAGVVVAAGSKTGYSLTATTGLGNQTADITGNLSGSVGSATTIGATGLDAIWEYAEASIGAGIGARLKTGIPNAAPGGLNGLPTVDASNYIAGIQSSGSLNQLDDLNNVSLTGVAAAVWDALVAGITTANSIGKRIVDYLTGDVYARVGAPAGASIAADVAAVKSDTAAILVDTGTTLDARIPAALTAAGNMKSDALAVNGSTAAAARLALTAANMVPGTVDTTVAPSTTEFEADDITEATADHYNGRIIIWTSGALVGQATSISDYAIAAGKGHFTVVAMTEAPANNDTFIIV